MRLYGRSARAVSMAAMWALAGCVLSGGVILGLRAASAQGKGAPEKGAPEKSAGGGTAKAAPELDRAALEKRFKEALTDVTLVGRWRLVKDGKLGEEKEDRYTIKSAVKVGALWIINARIQYGDRDVTVPVPVRVEWAGDTAVISVTDAGIPGIGTYTARVMISRGLYAGTWFASDHGGLMSGVIVKHLAPGKKASGAGEKRS